MKWAAWLIHEIRQSDTFDLRRKPTALRLPRIYDLSLDVEPPLVGTRR